MDRLCEAISEALVALQEREAGLRNLLGSGEAIGLPGLSSPQLSHSLERTRESSAVLRRLLVSLGGPGGPDGQS